MAENLEAAEPANILNDERAVASPTAPPCTPPARIPTRSVLP